MSGYLYLTFNTENSIIIFGERLGKSEIIFKGKPGFYDAIRLSDSSPPRDVDFSFQYIPLTYTPNETFHFHDPLLYQKFKFVIDHHSLIMFDYDNSLTPGSVFNIFNYFLIKKGNRLLFLTNVPNSKIIRTEKDNLLVQNNKQKQDQEDYINWKKSQGRQRK